jgi:hypothetical protein
MKVSPLLTNSVCSINSLSVFSRVPARVEHYHSVSTCERYTTVTNLGACNSVHSNKTSRICVSAQSYYMLKLHSIHCSTTVNCTLTFALIVPVRLVLLRKVTTSILHHTAFYHTTGSIYEQPITTNTSQYRLSLYSMNFEACVQSAFETYMYLSRE